MVTGLWDLVRDCNDCYLKLKKEGATNKAVRKAVRRGLRGEVERCDRDTCNYLLEVCKECSGIVPDVAFYLAEKFYND